MAKFKGRKLKHGSIAQPPIPKPCAACNGSGRYDSAGSPKCSACNGTGEQARRFVMRIRTVEYEPGWGWIARCPRTGKEVIHDFRWSSRAIARQVVSGVRHGS